MRASGDNGTRGNGSNGRAASLSDSESEGGDDSGGSPPLRDPLERLVQQLPGFRDIKSKKEMMKDIERQNRAERMRKKKTLGYGEWGADVELGDDWAYQPGQQPKLDDIVDKRPRYPGTDTPRDAWLRPIVDLQGIWDRVRFDKAPALERLRDEGRLNSGESIEALRFAGVGLFLIPFGLGFFISRGFAEPIIVYMREVRPESFQLSQSMKVEGAKHIKAEELRMRLEASIGKAPQLTPDEYYHQLQEAAHEFEHEKKEEIRAGLVNAISDSITLATFSITLYLRPDGRAALASALGRIAQGMSQTGKAFIIILVADILMGYHSEEGWTAALELLSEHYNAQIGFPPIAIFVSTVPVLLDTLFKYWLFKNLNRVDPSASVTLKEMDRH